MHVQTEVIPWDWADGGMAPPGSFDNKPHQLRPFSGDFSGAAWNSQALFATRAGRQIPKMRKAKRLAAKHGFTILSETHCLSGRADALRLPPYLTALWSDCSASQAGIGILLHHDFLKLFNKIDRAKDWEELEPGRVAVLHLNGDQGALDIFCVYLATGEESAAASRQSSIQLIGRHVKPKERVLTILAGDWNFVEEKQDRWTTATCEWSGGRDSQETKVFLDHIRNPHGLHEWCQSQYTCDNGGARSRIDRFYINQHLSNQLDKQCSCSVLEWDFHTSRHRALTFTRRTPPAKNREEKPLQPQDFNQKGWRENVVANFTDRCQHDSGNIANPVRRLVLLKDAIRHTTIAMKRSQACISEEEAPPEDSLGHTMSCIKAIEQKRLHSVRKCVQAYPKLEEWIPQYCDMAEVHSGITLQAIRDHAVTLAREIIQTEIHSLSTEGDPDDKASRKESILHKLKRLSPGESTTIDAMSDDSNKIHTDPKEIAEILRQHWKGVFKKKHVDDTALQIWMEELFIKDENGCFITGLPEKSDAVWTISRKAIRLAISSARDTMPGPDGIPARAYKQLGDIAEQILYDVATAIGNESPQQLLQEAYFDRCAGDRHDFNLSLLCCLPKKPHGIDEEAGAYFKGEDTRPLALVNTDNRIIASAARITWEPILATYISNNQQGFLKGRQMLNNVIDIDYNAMKVSLISDHGAIVLFDFKAAFPSMSHQFLRNSLRALGLPDHTLSFVESLYDYNFCNLSYKGEVYEGFSMECGVRQGCPISPLLFAACVDVLLRILQKRIPQGTFKAFADDIGAVFTDWDKDCAIAQVTFAEFERMSGMELNIKKTVCIPLWESGIQDISQSPRFASSSWQDIRLTDHGAYLGFVLGPGRCNKSWEKPLKKYISRCKSWSMVKAGLQYATIAYNTFAVSTLMFIAQLEQPPIEAFELETEGLKMMVPGPHEWRNDNDLFFLKEQFGQQKSFQSLTFCSQAAQLRVLFTHDSYRRRNQTLNITSIKNMHTDLQYNISYPEHPVRAYRWKNWYEKSHVSTLMQNHKALEREGIIIDNICTRIAGSPPPWDHQARLQQKAKFQKETTICIKQSRKSNPYYRIRHKLFRWFDKDRNGPRSRSIGFKLAGTPAQISNRVLNNLQRLPQLVPPRVCAAMWRLIFNGWCTPRRFQGRHLAVNHCVLGCGGEAEDSIEHYCCCPALQDSLKAKLRASVPNCSALSFWMMNETLQPHDEYLFCSALISYAGYMATNHYRHHGSTSYARAREAIHQFIIQGVSGHSRASAFLDNRWLTPIGHAV